MKQTTFQLPEIRDANDNIIQQGTYGKESPLVNSTNDGVLDYINNNLMYLYNNTMGGTGGEINTETITGKTGTITNLTATTVKAGTVTADALNGPLTGNVTGTADKAVADGDGNNIVNTYVTKSAVQGELTNYLPLSGGTLTGVVNGVTPPNGDNSKKLATTEFVNVKAGNYLPLSGGTMTGNTLITMGNGESYVRNWGNGLYLGGTYSENASRLVLFTNSNAGGFQLEAGNGTTLKRLWGCPNGTLTWDGNNILTAANYNSYALPLSGGTLTGAINTANNTWNKLGDDASFGDHNIGGKMCIKSQTARKTGIAFFNQSDTNVGEVDVNNAFDFNKPVKENGGFLVPIGVVQAFAGRTTPQGWLLCDGSAVSRTDYAALYAVIGTTYGTGDGSTTFNLPNLVNRMVVGSGSSYAIAATGGETSVTLNVSNIPSHGHMVRTWNNVSSGYPLVYRNGNWERWEEGCFQVSGKWQDNGGNTATAPHNGQGDPAGTTDGTGGNQPHNNMPPYLALRYIIKY